MSTGSAQAAVLGAGLLVAMVLGLELAILEDFIGAGLLSRCGVCGLVLLRGAPARGAAGQGHVHRVDHR